jgi:hypothetical protein
MRLVWHRMTAVQPVAKTLANASKHLSCQSGGTWVISSTSSGVGDVSPVPPNASSWSTLTT